jgi:Ser-tRNA(Ala) deacylase AlaX
MWCNQHFSYIYENTVMDIRVVSDYETANQLARIAYGDTAFAVDTTLYPLHIGCKYVDGVFYEEDGVTIIERNPTESEEIIALKAENSALHLENAEAQAEIDFRLSLLELGLV